MIKVSKEEIELYMFISSTIGNGKRIYIQSLDKLFKRRVIGVTVYCSRSPVAIVEEFSVHAIDGYNFVPLYTISRNHRLVTE